MVLQRECSKSLMWFCCNFNYTPEFSCLVVKLNIAKFSIAYLITHWVLTAKILPDHWHQLDEECPFSMLVQRSNKQFTTLLLNSAKEVEFSWDINQWLLRNAMLPDESVAVFVGLLCPFVGAWSTEFQQCTKCETLRQPNSFSEWNFTVVCWQQQWSCNDWMWIRWQVLLQLGCWKTSRHRTSRPLCCSFNYSLHVDPQSAPSDLKMFVLDDPFLDYLIPVVYLASYMEPCSVVDVDAFIENVLVLLKSTQFSAADQQGGPKSFRCYLLVCFSPGCLWEGMWCKGLHLHSGLGVLV